MASDVGAAEVCGADVGAVDGVDRQRLEVSGHPGEAGRAGAAASKNAVTAAGPTFLNDTLELYSYYELIKFKN